MDSSVFPLTLMMISLLCYWIEGGYRVIVNLEHPVRRPKVTRKLPVDVEFAVHSNQVCLLVGLELVVRINMVGVQHAPA